MSEIEEEIRRQMLAEREQTLPSPSTVAEPPLKESTLHRWQSRGGLLGALATVLLMLAKVGAPVFAVLAKLKGVLIGLKFLTFGKVLITGGSMFVSMWAYAQLFGWPFAVGIVLLIFIHEFGHAFAGYLRGKPFGMMVFIPLMGAFVTLKRGGSNLAEAAFIGIMGPVFGTLGGLACLGIHLIYPSLFWLALAYWNFSINLFNLTPMAPLDGGWIVPVFSPKLLAAGVVLLFILAPRNPLIWVLAFLSIPRIISAWKAKPAEDPYYRVQPIDRLRYGIA